MTVTNKRNTGSVPVPRARPQVPADVPTRTPSAARQPAVATPKAAPSAITTDRATERAVGNVPKPFNGTALTQNGLNPFSAREFGADVLNAVSGVGAASIQGVDPLGALSGVKDGTVQMEVPLKAGTYKAAGHEFTVQPNTVMRVDVEVRNGMVVPSRDRDGDSTGRGTKVEVHPPLDLPAWVEGKGAYVQDRGNGRGDITAKLGGWFDTKVQKNTSLALPDVVRTFTAGSEQPGGAKPSKKEAGFPTEMFQLDRAAFSGQVSMKDSVIQAGPAALDLAPGTKVTVSGNGQQARLQGDVRLDGGRINQDGAAIQMGPGSAKVDITYARSAQGNMDVRTQVTGLNAQLKGAELRAPGAGGKEDRISVGEVSVTQGRLDLSSSIRVDANGKPSVTGTRTSISLQASGTLNGAQLHIPDDKDTARVDVAAGRVEGRLEMGPSGVKVDASFKDVALGVEDLQTRGNGARADIHHARATGDATFKTDGRDFDLRVNARSLDVRVDDHAGRMHATQVDLGRSTITGSGTLSLGNRTGTDIRGNLNVDVTLDDLKVRNPANTPVVDVAQGGRIQGTIQSITAGTDGTFELQGRANLDARLEQVNIDLPGVKAQGTAQVKGPTDITITQDGVNFGNATARITGTVEDARIRAGEEGHLDLKAGSGIDLNVNQLGFNGVTGTSMTLGKGSTITGTLDSGRLLVGGTTLDLKPGSTATLDIDSVALRGSQRELTGKLTVDGRVATNTSVETFNSTPGMKITSPVAADGSLKVTVDNVALRQDGTATLRGVGVQLDARMGKVTGVTGQSTAAAQPLPTHAVTETPQLPATQSAPVKRSPTGVLSAQQVAQMNAVQMAGAQAVRGKDFNPLDVARQVKNGTVQVSIPVEGRVGEGWLTSATFPKGTTLDVTLQVKDGNIVRDQTRATFSHTGDGPAWVTVRGAYFDKEGTMRLDLGGMKDFAVPGFEKMPAGVDGFVNRLQTGQSSSGGSAGLNAFQLGGARVDVKDAQFRAGRIALPGGHVDLAEGSRLSVSGTLKAATLSGTVDLNGVSLQQDGIALDAGKGRADVRVEYRQQAGRAVVNTQLSNVNVETKYAVQKRANGDYVHLGAGRVENGTFTFGSTVALDRQGRPTGVTPGDVTMEVPRFVGTVQGARLTVPDADGTAQVEVGPSSVDGALSINGRQVALRGSVKGLDVAVSDLQTGTAQGRVDVEHARIRGDATVEFSSEKGIKVDGNVQDVSVVARRVLGQGGALTVDAGSTVVTGKGTLRLDSAGALSMEGNLHVDTQLNLVKGPGSPTVASGSRVVADVERVALGGDGGLTIKGRGVVDLNVKDLNTTLGGQRVVGDAHVQGGGNVTFDSKRGLSLPGQLAVDLRVADAQLGVGGQKVDLGGASRAQLLFTNLEVGPDGRPRQVDLGAGSRIRADVDGGTLSVPGLSGPLTLQSGTTGEFVMDNLTATEAGVKRAQGRLKLSAVVAANDAAFARLPQGVLRMERLQDGRMKLDVEIPSVTLREDGTFAVDGTGIRLDARVGQVKARTR